MGERRNASGGGHRAARGESARDPSVVDAAGDSFFRTVVESASDAVVTVDETGAIVFANPAVAETFGYEPSELVGRPAATLVPEQHRQRLRRDFERLRVAETDSLDDIELTARHRDGRAVPVEVSVRAHDHAGQRLLTAVARDVSDRRAERAERRRERDLNEQLLAVAPTGLLVITAEGVIERMNDRAGEILGVDPDAVTGETRRTDAWTLTDGDGDPVPPEERVFQIARDECRPVVAVEQRVERADGTSAWVQVSAAPLVEAGAVERVVVAVEDISSQKARERRLSDQNAQLERLDRVNAVIREIDRALVRATTRAEIDEAVCEALAGAAPYWFAWIGDVTGEGVSVRATGGDVADHIDAASLAPTDGSYTGPAAEAARSRSVQVVHDLREPGLAGLSDAAEISVRSAASVPLVYEQSLYGVLTVYADDPDVFDETEQAVLSELGATVAHALNAVTTRQALVADRVTELTVSVADDAELLPALSAAEDCEVTLEGATVRDDEPLCYFALVAGSTPEAVLAFAESFPAVESVRVVSVRPDDTCLIETVGGAAAFDAVAGRGGVVESARAVDGRCEMVVEVPPSADVRVLLDDLSETVDDAELLAQRERTRSDQSVTTIHTALDDLLTDRQRTALETAYYAGFFEWPRDSTGEEVADSLGVSAPTLHKHLRTAERKLFAELFGTFA